MNAAEHIIHWAREILSHSFCGRKGLAALEQCFRGFVAPLQEGGGGAHALSATKAGFQIV